ncbi:unnamed protein product [Ilex paraguariensis]|uniref:HMA domain-containing protein n=1 Tax=Ilex paraguariensis TaxID=185542 RepID=A0ABC8UK98_9AQUA
MPTMNNARYLATTNLQRRTYDYTSHNSCTKVNIHCQGCERDIKKLLKKIPGVCSTEIDAEQGTVTVSGTVHPQTVITILGKAGKVAELLPEQSFPAANNQNLQIVAQSQGVDQVHEQHTVAHELKQLNGIKGLKQAELTYKSIKLTFKDDVHDDVCRPRTPPSDRLGGGGGGGGMVLHDDDYGGFYNHDDKGIYWPPPDRRCSPPPGSPPPWQRKIPSAPPVVSDYDPIAPPQPVMGYPYSSRSRDEQPSCCVII